MAETVSSLLRRSIDHLATEVPKNHGRLVAELGALVVELDVDGEVFSVRAAGHGLEVVDGAAPGAVVRVATSRAGICSVLDAEVSLGEAVQDGRVDVHGGLDDLLRAHDALIAYGHAAVRAPSLPGLLDRFRAGGTR